MVKRYRLNRQITHTQKHTRTHTQSIYKMGAKPSAPAPVSGPMGDPYDPYDQMNNDDPYGQDDPYENPYYNGY